MNFNSNITFGKGIAANLIQSLTEDDLFVFSPTSMELADFNLPNHSNSLDSRTLGINLESIDKSLINLQYKRVIVFGNGKTTDIGKYAALKSRSELIIIPSVLSTNVFSTNKVCLSKEGIKVTLDGKIADLIMVDFDVLDKSDYSHHLYGLCDVISIHTALKDWELAESAGKEKIDSLTYSLSRSVLSELYSSVNNILEPNEESYKLIFKLILLSGYVTNMYGSGRPESGSEHFFSKILENKISIPHGISVPLGVMIISILQNNHPDKIYNLMSRIRLLNDLNKYPITTNLVTEVLHELKPRENRYTILDEVVLDDEKISSLIEGLISKYQLALK